jgi:hypothetical protein
MAPSGETPTASSPSPITEAGRSEARSEPAAGATLVSLKRRRSARTTASTTSANAARAFPARFARGPIVSGPKLTRRPSQLPAAGPAHLSEQLHLGLEGDAELLMDKATALGHQL